MLEGWVSELLFGPIQLGKRVMSPCNCSMQTENAFKFLFNLCIPPEMVWPIKCNLSSLRLGGIYNLRPRLDKISTTKNGSLSFAFKKTTTCIYMNSLKCCSMHVRPVEGSVTL